MNLSRFSVALGLLAAGVTVAQVTPEEAAAIRAAAPKAATVKPRQPRLLLVFNRFEGYQHTAIHHAAATLEILGKTTGAFETVQSDDYSSLLPESLKRFDGIFLNNTTTLKFDDPAVRKSILDFVAGGKGIAGVHAATDNFPTWPEGQELFGGVFDSHPWTSEGTWAVKISDPDHPLTAAFRRKDFVINDEIYRIRQVGLRKNCRVLLALDMKNSVNRKAAGVRPTDRDLPISWVRTYGKGRLFYCSLGHNDNVYTNPAVLQHYLDGIQFALGDLPAPTDPVPFDPMSFFEEGKLNELLGRISTYRYGDSRAPLLALDAFVRNVDDLPEARVKLESRFCQFIKSDATPAGRQFVCEKLVLVGSDACVPQLSGMLADTALAGRALLALAAIPGGEADAALLRALTVPEVPQQVKIEIIGALGDRRVGAASETLKGLAADRDEHVASAAVSALGRIGSAQSLDALTGLMASTKGRGDVAGAMLVAAERVRVFGDTARALKTYAELRGPAYPHAVRLAALRGVVLTDPANASKVLGEVFGSRDAEERAAAAMLAGGVQDTAAIHALARLFAGIPAGTQVQLLTALSGKSDAEVQKAVLAALDSKRGEVRMAAIRAASRGDAGVVAPLVRRAATAKGAEQKEARASLQQLRGAGVNDQLLALLARSDGGMKSEIAKTLAERKTPGSVPLLLKCATDPSSAVREEAVKALRALAGPEDVPAMVDLLVNSRDEGDMDRLAAAIGGAARRDSGGRGGDESVLAAYSRAKKPEVRAALIAAAGAIGSPASLPVLHDALVDGNREVRLAAIRALTVWPTPEPFADLWRLAGGRESAERTLALRGSVRLLGLDSTKAPEETIALYRKAMTMAPNDAERKALLSAAGESRSVAGLGMAADYLADRNLRGEAEAAIMRIVDALPDSLRRSVIPQLRQIRSSSTVQTNVAKAAEVIEKIELYDDYISSWEIDGPYHREWIRLLDEPFGPELTGGISDRWTPFRGGGDPQKPWLIDIGKTVSGEDNVVYLRTNVWSPSDGRARIEAGSDAGIKIWLNGKLVHSGSTIRGAGPGEDRVPVRVQKGWNAVMVKLEQGDGPWRACVRVRAADGGKLEGIRVSATQQ